MNDFDYDILAFKDLLKLFSKASYIQVNYCKSFKYDRVKGPVCYFEYNHFFNYLFIY